MTRITLVACLLLTPAALGGIVFDGSPYMGPPPLTLGPYEMTSFPYDERPIFEDVLSVPSPLGGDLSFSAPLNHRRIGEGWSHVGHGYWGDVYYYPYLTPEPLTLIMPPETTAFYFYVSPSETLRYQVTADDGTTSGVLLGGWDVASKYLGFYATDGDIIHTLTIEAQWGGFGIADLGIAIPEPASLTLLVLGGLAAFARRR